MPDIQDELDDLSCHSCGRCGKDIFDDPDPQMADIAGEDVVVCHDCWHILYPTTFCLVCSEEADNA